MDKEERRALLRSPDFRGWPVGWSIHQKCRFPDGYKITLTLDRDGRITSVEHGKRRIEKESIPDLSVLDAVGMLDAMAFRIEGNGLLDEQLAERYKRFRRDQKRLFRAVFLGWL